MAAMIAADDFVARAALDDEGLVAEGPVAVVDLGTSGSSSTVELTTLPIVLVGFGTHDAPLAGTLDVVTGDEKLVATIERTVASNPLAAVALALLLRKRDGRSMQEALVAESTTYSLLQAGPEFAAWRSTDTHAAPPPDVEAPVLIERDGQLLTVTLNRPHRHNAYSAAMRDGLVAALRLAIAEPTLRVLLTGAGPSFSSGGELGEFGTFGDPATSHIVRLTRSAAHLLSRLSERVEAHVHGSCLGAGVELPAFAARVVADPDTTFALPEVGLGLIPGAGGTASMPARIGRQRTLVMALTGEPIDAVTALDWGLVDELSAR